MSSLFSKILDQVKDFGAQIPFAPLIMFPVIVDDKNEYGHFVETLSQNQSFPFPVGAENIHPERWFYMNGVTSNKYLWYVQAKRLSEILGKKIEPLFNPTHTIFVDLVECIIGRIYNREAECDLAFIQILEPILRAGEEVHIVAYSQGGIITSNLVRELKNMNIDLSKFYVHTFASAHEDFQFDDVKIEHFANGWDAVSRSGVLKHGAGNAPIYKIPKKTGHFLVTHYLEDFVDGEYCNGKSMLYSYVKNKVV